MVYYEKNIRKIPLYFLPLLLSLIICFPAKAFARQNDPLIDFISDIDSNNAVYTIYDIEGNNITDTFRSSTSGLSLAETAAYLREGNYILEKYYPANISVLAVGGTENFDRYFYALLKDRNGMNSNEFDYYLTCSVTWDDSYGIYSGYCTIGSVKSRRGEAYLQAQPQCSATISSDRRTISYHAGSFVVGVEFPGIPGPRYYDLPACSANLSC